MTLRDWQYLPPDAAAREVHARVRTRLSPTQQRAVVAWLPDESSLASAFASASRGPEHRLGGVPFMAKDLFAIAGVPTRAGSTFLPEVEPAPTIDGALIRAARNAGLVCAGKTHLHEFAYGITGENPHYGDCEHPRFPGRTTGGSSSGSAAAVAAGIVPLAFGTDTGGSVRVPASMCGLYGFRLGPGDAWVRDVFPLSPSFDSVGWFTANAGDMRAVHRVLVGEPRTDSPRGCYLELPGLDSEVAVAFRKAAEGFAPCADAMTRDELQHGFAPALATYNTIVAIEAWQVHRSWAQRFKDRYDPAVWQRLSRVHALTPQDLDQAERHRIAIGLLWEKFLQAYDYLVLPATPSPALTKAECTLENRTRILTLTTPASVGGLPVLTIPVALPSGLSTGLQVVVKDPQSPALLAALCRAEEEALRIAA